MDRVAAGFVAPLSGGDVPRDEVVVERADVNPCGHGLGVGDPGLPGERDREPRRHLVGAPRDRTNHRRPLRRVAGLAQDGAVDHDRRVRDEAGSVTDSSGRGGLPRGRQLGEGDALHVSPGRLGGERCFVDVDREDDEREAHALQELAPARGRGREEQGQLGEAVSRHGVHCAVAHRRSLW